jgi:hypothetical protein
VKFILGVDDLYVVSGIIRRYFSRRPYSGIHGSKCENATFPSARNTAIIATSRGILLYIGAGLARRSIEVGDASAAARGLDLEVWTPAISGAMSFSETTIFAVNDSWLPSPCR